MNFQANQYASIFSTKLSSAYNQLRGDLGAPQTATDTIQKLVERIQTSPEVEDRRTAVLGLKGLSRDWKEVSWIWCEMKEGAVWTWTVPAQMDCTESIDIPISRSIPDSNG